MLSASQICDQDSHLHFSKWLSFLAWNPNHRDHNDMLKMSVWDHLVLSQHGGNCIQNKRGSVVSAHKGDANSALNPGEGQVSAPPSPPQLRNNSRPGCPRNLIQHLLLPSFTVRSKPERPCAALPYLNVKEITFLRILRHSAPYDVLKVLHCPLKKIHLNICLKNLKYCQHRTVELRKPEHCCHKRAKCSMLYSYIRQSYCCNNFFKKT